MAKSIVTAEKLNFVLVWATRVTNIFLLLNSISQFPGLIDLRKYGLSHFIFQILARTAPKGVLTASSSMYLGEWYSKRKSSLPFNAFCRILFPNKPEQNLVRALSFWSLSNLFACVYLG